MDELLKAKLDVEADINALLAEDDTAEIERQVEEYRKTLTQNREEEKGAQLAELNAGLKYIDRAIARAEAQKVAEIESEELTTEAEG